MEGGKPLLLLFSVLIFLKGSHQKPQVSMSPELPEVFIGDLFYLKCVDSINQSPVKWYFNDKNVPWMTTPYKIPAANPNYTGKYECEINGIKSDPFNIKIQEFEPIAALTIKTGHPVVQTGASVILNLHNDDGLQGWKCWVHREDKVRRIKLKLANEKSFDFQTYSHNVPETTYWCTKNGTETIRSNQITVRTSEKLVSLEMYPLPAIAGESLTLRCLTWGTDLIQKAVFYKDNKTLDGVTNDKLQIIDVTQAEAGKYRCHASFKYTANAAGPNYEVDSDVQDIPVRESLMRAVLSEEKYCSCNDCPEGDTHWYRKNDQSWEHLDSTTSYLEAEESGTYACRIVWKTGRSFLSNTLKHTPQLNLNLLLVIFLLIVAFVGVVGILIWRKKRNRNTGAIYEDVVRYQGSDKGEKDKTKEGEYEPLKKGEMKEGEYQTLEEASAAGGEGGYEALKKEGMKEGVYKTLETQGAAGGDGGYEALKKVEGKEGEYHTLKTQGATGGDGGYEALKKVEGKEGEYHTLKTQGATGGDGGYEALKKVEGKEGEYHTLKTQGAAGGDGDYEAVGKDEQNKE